MPDGTKVKVIVDDGKVETIHQTIRKIGDDRFFVVSGNNKTYSVDLSDKVRLELLDEVLVGDTAVIKTFPNKWLVVDVIAKELEPVLSPEEEKKELERQLKEIEDLYGGY